MLIVRDVFQARYGKGGELIAMFKEAAQKWPDAYGGRVLSDVSGPFFTVVAETQIESLSQWEARTKEYFSIPEFGKWFARMQPLVESGRREFYSVEQ